MRVAALLLGLCMSISAHAQLGQTPISLVADRVQFNERTGVAIYSGNVKLSQGELAILANNLQVNLDASRSIKSATATGNVRLYQSVRGIQTQASAQKIIYTNGRAELVGGARLVKGDSSVAGERIVYYADGRIEAVGGKGQVKMTFAPSQSFLPSGGR